MGTDTLRLGSSLLHEGADLQLDLLRRPPPRRRRTRRIQVALRARDAGAELRELLARGRLLAGLGCDASPDRRIAEGEEPIAALQVRHRSRRYDTAYWATQARASTALWAIALQFCRSEGKDLAAHPNCASVIAVDAQMQGGRSRRAAPVRLAA